MLSERFSRGRSCTSFFSSGVRLDTILCFHSFIILPALRKKKYFRNASFHGLICKNYKSTLLSFFPSYAHFSSQLLWQIFPFFFSFFFILEQQLKETYVIDTLTNVTIDCAGPESSKGLVRVCLSGSSYGSMSAPLNVTLHLKKSTIHFYLMPSTNEKQMNKSQSPFRLIIKKKNK